MSLHLLFHDLGFMLGAILAIVVGSAVFYKDRRNIANIMFSLGSLGVAVYCVSHVIGVSVADPVVSRNVLMFNLVNILLTSFMAHSVFAVIGEAKKQKIFLISMYAVGAAMLIFYVAFPNSFLLPSEPKLYFPNYYVAGNMQWMMRLVFNVIVPIYFTIRMAVVYGRSDMVMKNRLKYFFVAYVLGYSLGALAIPLVYGFPVDPAWSAFFVPIYTIPLGYAMVRYSLLDIRVVAKRAFFFAIVVAVSSFAVFLVGYANSALISLAPDFPVWVLPLAAGIAATAVGYFIWGKFKESETLKYEFVSIMTHKLRTPLTSIRWSAENISAALSSKNRSDVAHIEESVDRLVELTNILEGVSSEDENRYDYRFEDTDITSLCRDIAANYSDRAANKGVSLQTEGLYGGPIEVRADVERFRSAVQIILDNALTYTPKGGTVDMSVRRDSRSAVVSVKDTGIGIDKSDIHRVFLRLYRSDAARKVDTEGMGVGLFTAKNIVERHNGRISVQSEGLGKGSTFSISLPARLS